MNVTRMKKSLSSILCMVLIAAAALTTTGCSDSKPDTPAESPLYAVSETPHVLGEGETTFPFSVIDENGEEIKFEVSTHETIVGAALQELGLIEGEDSQYGLMVSTVNGLRRDYEEDGMYWAFYIDGAYAMSGVDSTEIAEGQHYSFQVLQA